MLSGSARGQSCSCAPEKSQFTRGHVEALLNGDHGVNRHFLQNCNQCTAVVYRSAATEAGNNDAYDMLEGTRKASRVFSGLLLNPFSSVVYA